MTVILFDIDGTLILTDSAGQKAMEQVVPVGSNPPKAPGEFSYAGRTDRSIVADHLRRLGLEDTHENFLDYTQDFLNRLPESLSTRKGTVLPGVVETLQRLSACASVHLGLLTGNLRAAAHMKLSHFGLDSFFVSTGEFVGGFGDEHHERDDVARVAMSQAREAFGPVIASEDVWVIGDTPRDVRCARAIEANVLAVATGGYSESQLLECEPDLFAANLPQADQWWDQLCAKNPTL